MLSDADDTVASPTNAMEPSRVKPALTAMLRPVLALAAIAVVAVPAAFVLAGSVGGSVATVLFVLGAFAWSAPKVYPDGQLRFAVKIPTRVAYRRAGCRDWTVACGLHQHDITPALTADLIDAGYTTRALAMIVSRLDDCDHPDGPFVVEFALARGAVPGLFKGLQSLLNLPPQQRADATRYATFEDLAVLDIADLCRAAVPFPLADRVHQASTRVPGQVFPRFLRLWTNPDVQASLGVGAGGRPTSPDRLAEHLNEWMDAVPGITGPRAAEDGDAAELIAGYGTIPLAGWWFAAGYSPQEATEVAAQRDWSLGHLAALAALRQGPPVTAAPTP